jgi:hypothetical protein
MVEFAGFDKKVLEEILKGNEDAALSKKTNLISDWCKKQEEKKAEAKKEKEEGKEESKKETKDEKKTEKEEKKTTKPTLVQKIGQSKKDAGEEVIDTSGKKTKDLEDKKSPEKEEEEKDIFDTETIFGLENDEKFKKVFESVKKYGSTNYNDEGNKPKKARGTLFNTIYNVKGDNIEGEYATAVRNYYTSMCRRTIMSFFKISKVEKLLTLLLSSKKDTDNFVKFVMIIGNELNMTKLSLIDDKPYEDLKHILSNIIESCKANKEFTPFLSKLLNEVIVNGTIKGLKTALEAGAKEVKTYFNNESIAVETMNLYILTDIIHLYLKHCPELIFENEKQFKKLMTMLLLIPCVFRGDTRLQKYIYSAVLKIVVLVQQGITKYSRKIKEDLLSLKIFKKLVESIKFEKDSANSYEFKLTDEHKGLFEIFLKLSEIHKDCISEGIEPIYTYTEPLLQMETCKIVLKERKLFDHIAYSMYLDELDDTSKKSTILYETQHPHFEPKVTSCLRHEGFKKMVLKIQSGSELEKYSSIAVTSDKKGENVLKNIFQKDIDDNKTEVTIFSNSCYVHYPYKQPKIIAFGEKDQNKLGTEASNDGTKEPEVVPVLFNNLKCLSSHQKFTVALDEKGKVYYTGYKVTFSQTFTQFTEKEVKGLKKDKEEDEVVKLVAGFDNVIALTKKGRIFIEGSNTEYQIDDTGDKYELTEKKIPSDDDPVIDVSAGKYFHLIVTKSGKLYGAGNYFLKDIKLECGKKYAKIELPAGVKAKKAFCTNIEKP